MTVGSATSPQSLASNGVTTEFPFTFKALSIDDITVEFEDEDGNNSTVDPGDYTVTLAGATDGGTVEFDTAPDDGGTVIIISSRAYTQTTDIKNHESYRPDQVEAAIDSNTILIKQLQAQVTEAEEATGLPTDLVISGTSPIRIDGGNSADLADEPTITFVPSAVKLDDFGAPDDNTDLDASTTAHGLLPKRPDTLATGKVFRGDGTYVEDICSIDVNIDNNGEEIVDDITVDKVIPFNCTIVSATLFADPAGDVSVDIQVDTYANFPPDGSDSIVASAPPVLTADAKYQDTTLTGWDKEITAGDVVRFAFTGFATLTRLSLALKVRRHT